MADTALVLGGGGLTAYGWQIGVLAGLADAGVDLADADVLAGTSAGSLLALDLARVRPRPASTRSSSTVNAPCWTWTSPSA